MTDAKIKAGSCFDTQSRKGALTVRFLSDFTPGADVFVEAEILDGRARYMSEAYQIAQDEVGMGTQGDIIPMRASLLTLVRRRNDLEARLPHD